MSDRLGERMALLLSNQRRGGHMGVSVHLGAYTLSWSTSMEFVSLFHPPLTIELGLTDAIRRFAPPNALMRMRREMARMENKTSRSWRAVKSAFSA